MVAIVLAGCVAMTGCASRQATNPESPSKSSPASDPIVERALAGVETTGAPYISGEIVGYLVDFTVREGSDARAIVEVVVMSDGSVRRLDTGGMNRPSGAFGRAPGDRLGPESADETAARELAIAKGRDVVVEKYPNMSEAESVVYEYLVRLKAKDGTTLDVWVDVLGRGVNVAKPETLKPWRP